MTSTAQQTPQGEVFLNPENFQSLLPKVNKLLELIRASAAPAPASPGESETQATDGSITKAAIEIRTQLARMKDEIEKLPGGHLSIQEIREVSARLTLEADKRQQLLRALTSLDMPILDDCVKQVEAGEEAAATADGRIEHTPADVIMDT